MKDERIQTTVNRFAAGGFFIWYLLLAISLIYRTLILQQPIRDYWDIFAIFSLGTLFVFVAYATQGVFDTTFKRRWLIIGIAAFLGILTAQFFAGRLHSLVDAAALLLGFIPGFGLCLALALFLNRRWLRKEDIQDDQ